MNWNDVPLGIPIVLVCAFGGIIIMIQIINSLRQDLKIQQQETNKQKEWVEVWKNAAANWKEIARRQNMEQVEGKKKEDPVVDNVVKQVLEEFDKLPLQKISAVFLPYCESNKLECERELIRQRVEKLVNWLADKAKTAEEKAS